MRILGWSVVFVLIGANLFSESNSPVLDSHAGSAVVRPQVQGGVIQPYNIKALDECSVFQPARTQSGVTAGGGGIPIGVVTPGQTPQEIPQTSQPTQKTTSSSQSQLGKAEVGAILDRECSRCHNPSGMKPEPLINSSLLNNITQNRSLLERVVARISDGTMPQDKPGFGASSEGQAVVSFINTELSKP